MAVSGLDSLGTLRATFIRPSKRLRALPCAALPRCRRAQRFVNASRLGSASRRSWLRGLQRESERRPPVQAPAS
eukprot:7639628-Alexandrium_andersonii.AAC.1